MATINVKGHEFHAVLARDAFSRRANQYKNNIVASLNRLGIISDDIILDLEPKAIQNLPASVTWYVDGYRLYYSCKSAKKYVDNLFIVCKVIELEVEAVLDESKTFDEFLSDFTESHDVEHARKAARKTLGIDDDVHDIAQIDSAYKVLAKKHHPDMSSGDAETFQKINIAHKILKRELC